MCVSIVLIEFETFRASVGTKEKGNARIMTILITATADDWSACHEGLFRVCGVSVFVFVQKYRLGFISRRIRTGNWPVLSTYFLL